MVFIDSLQFRNSSLDSLVQNLSDNDFKYLSEEFSGEFLKLVKHKGMYPYEYMDSFKKFSEDKLPDRCKFFSSLKDVWAMSQYLPYSGFKWLNQKEISDFCLNSVSENSSIGYILEVDLEYPSKLHELHNDYPLDPEKFEISQNMLSNYCSNIANEYGIKIGGVNKLVPNLGNKSKYVVHYRNLHLYLSLGMKQTKVHRILKFKQSFKHLNNVKKCTDFNTDKRKNAGNTFEKDIFKLVNNNTFGKTMENLRKKNKC